MRSARRLSCLVLFLCAPVLARAQATGSEIPVNTTTADSQSASRIAMDGSGRFVVVWQSLNQDVNPGFGVYMRRFSIAGVPLAGEVLVNQTTTGSQKAPAVSTDDAGNIVVVWEGDDGAGRGIFARLYSAAGVALTPEIPVNVTTAGDQLNPVVSMSTGKFVVVWQGPDSDLNGIYGRRFDSAGNPLDGSDLALSCVGTGDQTRPTVGMDSTHRFYTAWESAGQDGDGLGVYARRFEADGSARDAAEFLVNTTTANDQKLPALAAALNGDFVVVWQSAQAADADGGIFARRYNQNGAVQGAEFRVNSTTAGAQHGAAVGMDANGNFVLAWAGPDADSDGIFGQRYRADGVAMGAEFPANTATTGLQAEAGVAMNRRNQPLVDSQVFALAWTSPDAALDGITARMGSFGNSVTVLAPDDGRPWAVGSLQRIRFAHTLPNATKNFKIELIVNAGPPQTLQASFLAGRTVGNYQHTVTDPGLPGVFNGVIRVTSTVDPLATDDSASFLIQLPTITMLQPPPDVLQNVATDVKWGHNLGLQSHVKVELARNGTTFNEVLSADVTNGWAHEGRFNWVPTGTCTTTGSCKIRVSWLDDLAVFGESGSFDIINVIFVKNDAGGGGDGSMALPYNTLADAQTNSVAGNWIFVYEGDGTTTGYDAGILLKDQQKLIGEGVGLVIGGNTVVGAGNPPHITNTAGHVVNLALDNEVAGVTLEPQASAGIHRSGALGAASVHDATITPSNASDGILLDTTPSGTLTLTNSTLSGNTTGTGIKVVAGSANLTGSGNTVSITTGRLLDVQNTTGGNIQMTGGTLTNVLGTGILFNANAGASANVFHNVTVGAQAGAKGVQLTPNAGFPGSFSFSDLDVTTALGTALQATNAGSLSVTAGPTGSTLNATGGEALLADTTLVSATFASVTVNAGTTRCVVLNNLTATSTTTIQALDLASSNAVSGCFFASTARTLNVSGGANAITVSNGTAVNVSSTALSANFGNVTKTAGGLPGVALSTNTGTATFAKLDIATTSGSGLIASNAGTVHVTDSSSTVVSTGGPGVSIANTTVGNGSGGAMTLATVSSSGSATVGISLDGISGSFTANAGSITTAAGTDFYVNAGLATSAISYGGSITNTGGEAVRVQGRSGGSVTLSGNINSTVGAGIIAQNNTGGAITFSGATKALNTSVTAVTLTNNTGATIDFTGGGLDIDTTGAGTGIAMTGGGTLTVTGANNSMSHNGTSRAFNMANSTIGGAGVTFERIDVSNGVNAVLLDQVMGTFSITGDGSTLGSGGTIQNTSGDGIRVLATSGSRTLDVQYTDFTSIPGDDAIVFIPTNSASGTLNVSFNQFTDVFSDALQTAPDATSTGTVAVNFHDNTSTISPLNVGSYAGSVTVYGRGSMNASLTAQSNVFTRASGAGNIAALAQETATLTTIIGGGGLANTLTDPDGAGIYLESDNTATHNARVENNAITNSGGEGIQAFNWGSTGVSKLRVALLGNTVDGHNLNPAAAFLGGIAVYDSISGNSDTCLRLQNNTVLNSGAFTDFELDELDGDGIPLNGELFRFQMAGTGNITAADVTNAPQNNVAGGGGGISIVQPVVRSNGATCPAIP